MISGNEENTDSPLGEPCQYCIEEFHRLRRRDGAVIDISRNDERVGAQISTERKEFLQYIRLIFCHVPLPEEFSQMPIRRMDEPHDIPSFHIMIALPQQEFPRPMNCRFPSGGRPYPKISLPSDSPEYRRMP